MNIYLVYCVIFLLVAFGVTGYGQQSIAKERALFPVMQNDKYGYIDITGRMVISPQFDLASPFSEGLAIVRVARGSSFIDRRGQMLITPLKGKIYDFYEGLAMICQVLQTVEKCGYLDRNGKLAVAMDYDPPRGSRPHFYRFSEGVAGVMKNGKGGYIDRTGRYVIEPRFDLVFFFSEGLAEVKIGARYGFIDHSGRYVIDPIYMDAYSFIEGLAVASLDRHMAGFIDNKGRWVIAPRFQRGFLDNFYEGRAMVRTDGKMGYIDKNGKFIIRPVHGHRDDPQDLTHRFSEGLAVVDVGGKRGYMNKLGKVTIKPRFDSAGPFFGGLARVGVRGRIGYINRTGKYVWRPSNSWLSKNTEVLPPQY